MKCFGIMLAMAAVVGSTSSVFASEMETSCNDSTMGAFNLNTNSSGTITSGSIGFIYKLYRKCDLTQENTRIVTEYGESILKGDCVGSAKLLYDHMRKILYAVEPEKNRKIAVSHCTSFAQDVDPTRLIFELRASVREKLDQTSYDELEKKATAQLFRDAKDHCVSVARSGHVRPMSAVQTSSGLTDHFGKFGSGSAEAIFLCD